MHDIIANGMTEVKLTYDQSCHRFVELAAGVSTLSGVTCVVVQNGVFPMSKHRLPLPSAMRLQRLL